MTDNKFQNKYRIESARLKGWDYASDGYYYVTICTKDRELFFGDIKNGRMALNDIGKIAQNYLLEIPDHFKNAELDKFVVMPNYVHGIIVICNNGTVETRHCLVSTVDNTNHSNNNNRQYTGKFPQMSKISPKPKSLPIIIGSFKSICTRIINKKFPKIDFAWQSRFHDSIIRNQTALNKIRNYIKINPLKWELDRNNPINF